MAVVGASTGTAEGWRVPAELQNGTLVVVEFGARAVVAEAVGCRSSAIVSVFDSSGIKKEKNNFLL